MKPGIYTNISYEDYDAIPAFSNSLASYLEECPAILRQQMQYKERRDTPALKLGRAVHEAVFEPDTFSSKKNFAISPKFGRTKVELEAKERFFAENAGKTVLDHEDYTTALDIASSVLKTTTGKSTINGSQSEVTVVWRCPETDVLCKGRIDAWNKQLATIIDLKTLSDSLHDHSLKRVMHGRRYYRQLAWYSYGLDLCGEPTDLQILIFVQKRRPYPTAFKAIDFSAIEQGKREMKVLVKQYAECLSKDKWPGFPDAISTLSLPEYAKKYESGEDFTAYTDLVHEELIANGQ